MEMSLAINGLSVEAMGKDFVTSLHKLFHRSLVISLSLAAFYHLVNYYYWTKDKAFAKLYMKVLINAGGPILILMGISMVFNGAFFGFILLILGLMDTSLVFGLQKHQKD